MQIALVSGYFIVDISQITLGEKCHALNKHFQADPFTTF